MENLVVIFGGQSTEHDISIISAVQAMENIDRKKYKIYPVYVDKNGEWWTGKKLENIESFKDFNTKKLQKVCIVPNYQYLYKKSLHSTKIITKIDCIFNIFHGKNGEDGTMQSLFTLCKIPYTSPETLGSSVGMDKIVQKSIFKALSIDIIDCFWFTKDEYYNDENKILANKNFEYPKIVKPSSLGSSIGINICDNENQLEEAIDLALKFDDRIIIEKALLNIKEINIALFKVGDEIIFSGLEQPKNWKHLLDFEQKYISTKSKILVGNSKVKINKKVYQKIKENAQKVYKLLDLKGVVRFDFMLDKDTKKLYLNEINTIPGSNAFYLFKENGISYSKLIDMMINEAKNNFYQKSKNQTIYASNVLKTTKKGTKIKK